MFENREFFLHIGVLKSGSTALQLSVFPFCEDVSYFGKPLPRLSAFIRAMTSLDDAAWALHLPNFVEEARIQFSMAGSRVLLSEEEFSSGGGRMDGADRDTIAKRLHALFPKATVIVVVRNQISALQSLYCYAMAQPDGGFKSFDAWLRDLSSISSRGRGLELFKYADLVSTYAALFGKERVKVLFYEDMAKNYQAFAEQFATILGAHPARFAAIPVERHNIRPSTRKLRALDFARRFPWIPRLVDRLPARVATKLLAFIERGASLDVSYTEANERFVRAYYAANNRALAAWLDEDLAPRKYPLDPIESSRAPGNCP